LPAHPVQPPTSADASRMCLPGRQRRQVWLRACPSP
jgi:hypothetical protein